MAIPKTIYQTFKTSELPFLTKWHVSRFRKNNPEYAYEFYDDKRIIEFFKDEFSEDVLQSYLKLNIGAAKADMFRYAVLYKKGGVYLDVDSDITGRLDDFILPTDSAVISRESHPNLFVQWALIFEAGHPILKRTLDLVLDNISHNRYPHDVHAMTGPTVFTQAVNEFVTQTSSSPYRIMGVDYDGRLKFKYKLSKLLLYNSGEHWKKKQVSTPVLKVTESFSSNNQKVGIDNIYVVHGIRGYEHREQLLQSLLKEKNGLEYELVTESEDDSVNQELVNKYFSNEAKQCLSKGQLMCSLVHILIYEKIVENKDQFAIIFENDVLFINEFQTGIKRVINEARQLSKGWLVSLENSTLKFPSIWETRKNKYLYAAPNGRCAGAYMVDFEAAKNILEELKSNKCNDVIDLWHNTLVKKDVFKMYWAHPPLTEQASSNGFVDSSLATNKKGLKRYLQWEIQKFYKMYIVRLFKSRGLA